MTAGMKLANTVAGLKIDFTLVQPAFKDWIEKNGLERSTLINDTTKKDLAKSLSDGIQNGESILELQDRVKDQFDGLRDYRSERIARSESSITMNAGTLDTYKAGGVSKKEWLATLDGREREAHAEADGQIVNIDEPFIVDGEELMYPGDPAGSAENTINERCTIMPVIDDNNE